VIYNSKRSLTALNEYVAKTQSELKEDWNNHCHLLLATHGDLPQEEWYEVMRFSSSLHRPCEG
jgi:hypothetical protein